MVNIHFLLFYCILLCAPEQQEQIQAITIKSGHTPWLSNTIMMRILMRHLSKTPHHPHSSATTCHPKWGISCLQMAHCTLFTAFFGPTFDFAVRTWFKQQLTGTGKPRDSAELTSQESGVFWHGAWPTERKGPSSAPPNINPSESGRMSYFRRVWNQKRRGSARQGKSKQTNKQSCSTFWYFLFPTSTLTSSQQREIWQKLWTKSLSFLGPLESLWWCERVFKVEAQVMDSLFKTVWDLL